MVRSLEKSKDIYLKLYSRLEYIRDIVLQKGDSEVRIDCSVFVPGQIELMQNFFLQDDLFRFLNSKETYTREEITQSEDYRRLTYSLKNNIEIFWDQLANWYTLVKEREESQEQEQEEKKKRKKKIGKKKEMTFLAQILFSIKEKILGPNPSQSNWENSHEFFFSKKSLFFGFFIVFLAGLLLGLSISFWYQRQKEKKKEKEKEKEKEKVNKEKIGT
ncbi:hypothetical protein CMESO_567 (nucleomorph) [Chroomonas mesostigmatica CCMP1168]|uniref:Uncharacterized protein n=1 Tax=Chroomonas mesostigmatica CCMP1168 TaxID=1195612 RepID=J7G5M1_9CRYP|nr:hypothetical protein CMESO_207 [Chroomonas mesostigmatica CCMP1168]AFP65553.1 hypothetical protein CMESO_400 [Chroomonas mesostigmatica CCMP1168]AFP65707.1 hypothetical protein CMESO_567 [Chroomonas mesostigmatica CCMP1168]